MSDSAIEADPGELPKSAGATTGPTTGAATGAATVSRTLGGWLAAERESRTWSIEQVASQLNLAPRQIQALESDNYAALPGMASVRGFVRAYAKLLKIDASPLIGMIASEQIAPTRPLGPTRNLSATPFSDNRLLSSSRRSSPRLMILAAAVIVLLAIAVIVLERLGGWPALSQSLSSQIKDISTVPAVAAPGVPASAMTGDSLRALNPAPLSAAGSAPPDTGESGGGEAVTIKHNQESAGSESVAGAQASDATVASARNLLVLKLRQDSWVQVRVGNNALISRLDKAGSVESLHIDKPAKLTLGNAVGVDATFRGVPLEFKADVKSNVVRLSLQ